MDNPGTPMSVEELVERWNKNMKFSLSVSDLSPTVKPTVWFGALMEVLCKLGIDPEAITAPPPEHERDEHTEYYLDLIPVINMTRILSHIYSEVQFEFTTTLMDQLQPSSSYAVGVLIFLHNMENFYSTQREAIEPRVKEVYKHHEMTATLEEERNKLLGELNEQAAAKASRVMRLQQLEEDKRILLEEIKREKQHHEHELRELQVVENENQVLQTQLDKASLHRDHLLAEVARVKAQKVNDAEDIKCQYEQAVRGEKEVTGALEDMKENLRQKETTVRNLNAVKGKLYEGIQYVQEITTLTNTLKEATLSSRREQAEVESVVREQETALREVETQLAALHAARRDVREQRERDVSEAGLTVKQAHRDLKEAETRHKLSAESAARAEQDALELRARTAAYTQEKAQLEDTMQDITDNFHTQLKSFEDKLLAMSKNAVGTMEEKLNKFNKR